MKQQLLESIGGIERDIWASTLDLEVRPGAHRAHGLRGGLRACVHITGGWRGTIALACSLPLARTVAKRMFQCPEASDEQCDDALCELANMTGGNFKAMFPGSCYLSLPAVVESTDGVIRFPRSVMVGEVYLECDEEALVVSVHEGVDEPPGGAGSPIVA